MCSVSDKDWRVCVRPDADSEAVAPDGATTEMDIWWCEKGGSEVMDMGDRRLVVVCSKICVLVDGIALLGRRGDLLGDTWCIETLSYFPTRGP
jgi:hypothetical protein